MDENAIKKIRDRLGVTQAVLAANLGVTQGNISFYERGHQMVSPVVAKRLVAYSKKLGHEVTFEEIYADVPLVPVPSPQEAA